MDFKPIPGPYAVELGYGRRKILSEQGSIIAYVPINPNNSERSKRSAHLLAAAPEMRDLLEEIIASGMLRGELEMRAQDILLEIKYCRKERAIEAGDAP